MSIPAPAPVHDTLDDDDNHDDDDDDDDDTLDDDDNNEDDYDCEVPPQCQKY